MGKFHALLVGINQYELKSGEESIDLSGCLHDVDLFKSYLEEKIPAADRQIFEPLLNQKATKAGVVHAIRTQLGEAGPEDTALFYFSGHGCRETGGETLQPFIIGDKIEALVCHDSFAGDATTPLADLEIRYLFNQLATGESPPGRIIIITDSCNSGGVTRSLFNLKPRLGPVAGLRNWEQFIFHEQIREDQLKQTTSLDELFPTARHIHLAACESQQSAFEASGQFGVFTSNLVEMLRNTSGRITFRDLHSRVKYLVRRKFKAQTPQIYSYDPAGEWAPGAGQQSVARDQLDTEFLRGISAESRLNANVHYFSYKWVVDKGAIHGVPPLEIANEQLNITIMESRNGAKKVVVENAQIRKVEPTTTRLGGAVISKLDRNHPESYTAAIAGLYLDPLNVQVFGDNDLIAQLTEEGSEYAAQLAERNIRLRAENDPVSPDYKLITSAESYLLTTARDANDPALVRPICGEVLRSSDLKLPDLVHYLSTIARWQFVVGLHNLKPELDLHNQVHWELVWTPATRSADAEHLLEERRVDLDSESTDSQAHDSMDYPVIDLEVPAPDAADLSTYLRFRIRLQNHSPAPVYVSVLYLGQLFNIHSKVFEDQSNVIRLDGAGGLGSGHSAWALNTINKAGTKFTLSKFIRNNNWEEETFFLKLIISNTEFDLGDTFDQSRLPPPGERTRGTDALEEYRSAAQPDIPDWAAKMVEVRVKNPAYKPPAVIA